MVNFYSVVVLAAAVSAATILKREASTVATVLANLKTIDTQTDALTAAIVAWDASLLGALGVQTDVTNLETAINTATTEAKTETQASSADSQTILAYVSGTLNPDIVASLNEIVSRAGAFATLSVASLVLSDLETLQTDTDALGATLIALASSDTKAEAEALVADIDAAFKTAIAAFS